MVDMRMPPDEEGAGSGREWEWDDNWSGLP